MHDDDGGNDDDDGGGGGGGVVTEAELMSSIQQRDATDVSFDSLQQSGQ